MVGRQRKEERQRLSGGDSVERAGRVAKDVALAGPGQRIPTAIGSTARELYGVATDKPKAKMPTYSRSATMADFMRGARPIPTAAMSDAGRRAEEARQRYMKESRTKSAATERPKTPPRKDDLSGV